jgi:SpoIIAA-like
VVTDVEWIAKATHMFAWMAPGELNVYPLDQLEDAKAWVAG